MNIQEIISASKKEAENAYLVTFPRFENFILDKILNKDSNFLEQKTYTFLSLCPCNLWDVVITLSRMKEGFVPTLGLVIDSVPYNIATKDSRVASSETGMIVSTVDYITFLHNQKKWQDDRDKELEEIRKQLEMEKEKIVLETLTKTNPELFNRIEQFRKNNPNILIGVNDGTSTDKY